MNEWQPMEGFPIDQPLLLFYKDYGQTVGAFTANHWITDDNRIRVNTVPDRWMLSPEDDLSKWQVIEIAPHDRSVILFYPDRKLNKRIGKWDEATQAFNLQWPSKNRSD